MPVTNSGYVYPFNGQAGLGSDVMATQADQFMQFNSGSVIPEAGTPVTTDVAIAQPKTSTMWYLAGVVLLIIALKFAIEHEKSGIEPAFVGIGVYNFMAIGLMALLFLILIKVTVNKYQVPGLTQLVNAS